MGPEVWKGDAPPPARGVVILGTPVGSREFIASHAQTRMAEEQRLLDMLGHVPDAQCAWILLRYCASPRANHLMRMVPPDQLREYARLHDEAVWNALRAILGADGLSAEEEELARALASLPGRMGGLGLQNASRSSVGAYWAAWADALPTLQARRPVEAASLLLALDSLRPLPPSFAALREAASVGSRQTR